MDGKEEYSVIVEDEDAVEEAFWWGASLWGKMALAIARERGLLDKREDEEVVQGKAQDFC